MEGAEADNRALMAVGTMEITFRKVISMRQPSFILKYVKYKGLGTVTGELLIKQKTPIIAGLVAASTCENS